MILRNNEICEEIFFAFLWREYMESGDKEKNAHERFNERLNEPLDFTVVEQGVMTEDEKEKNDKINQEVLKLVEESF